MVHNPCGPPNKVKGVVREEVNYYFASKTVSDNFPNIYVLLPYKNKIVRCLETRWVYITFFPRGYRGRLLVTIWRHCRTGKKHLWYLSRSSNSWPITSCKEIITIFLIEVFCILCFSLTAAHWHFLNKFFHIQPPIFSHPKTHKIVTGYKSVSLIFTELACLPKRIFRKREGSYSFHGLNVGLIARCNSRLMRDSLTFRRSVLWNLVNNIIPLNLMASESIAHLCLRNNC